MADLVTLAHHAITHIVLHQCLYHREYGNLHGAGGVCVARPHARWNALVQEHRKRGRRGRNEDATPNHDKLVADFPLRPFTSACDIVLQPLEIRGLIQLLPELVPNIEHQNQDRTGGHDFRVTRDSASTTVLVLPTLYLTEKSKPIKLLIHRCWGMVERRWSRGNFRL